MGSDCVIAHFFYFSLSLQRQVIFNIPEYNNSDVNEAKHVYTQYLSNY